MPATTPRPPSSEQVAAFDRNAWPRSIGIPGRNRRNPHAERAKPEEFALSVANTAQLRALTGGSDGKNEPTRFSTVISETCWRRGRPPPPNTATTEDTR